MHVLLIRNRDSGAADEIDPARMLVERGCTVTDADIDDAVRWERTPPATMRSVERVIVAGGDGTIGLAASLAMQLSVPLGVVPSGTANDFARTLDLPDDLEQACLLAATGTKTRLVDLGRIGDRPFVNVVSFGIAPEATRHATALKRAFRALAYPIGAVLGAAKADTLGAIVTVDGEQEWAGSARQIMVASSGGFGGWADAGGVTQGDGQIDLVIVPTGRGVRAGAVDAAALLSGNLAARDGIVHLRGLEIAIELQQPEPCVVDGELVEFDSRYVVARAERARVQLVVG